MRVVRVEPKQLWRLAAASVVVLVFLFTAYSLIGTSHDNASSSSNVKSHKHGSSSDNRDGGDDGDSNGSDSGDNDGTDDGDAEWLGYHQYLGAGTIDIRDLLKHQNKEISKDGMNRAVLVGSKKLVQTMGRVVVTNDILHEVENHVRRHEGGVGELEGAAANSLEIPSLPSTSTSTSTSSPHHEASGRRESNDKTGDNTNDDDDDDEDDEDDADDADDDDHIVAANEALQNLRFSPYQVFFDWSGVEFHASFSGASSIYAVLTDEASQYSCFLNGKEERSIVTAAYLPSAPFPTAPLKVPKAYLIASNLDPSEIYTVRVAKRTEAAAGIAIFHGFLLEKYAPPQVASALRMRLLRPPKPYTMLYGSIEEQLTEANHGLVSGKSHHELPLSNSPRQPPRLLEFLGDSITTGYGVLGQDPCIYSYDTQSSLETYATLVAVRLKALFHIEAWRGMGVVKNTNSVPTTFAGLFPRALANLPSVLWNFHKFVPSAVVVYLGTNDFLSMDSPPPMEFTKKLVELVQEIRKVYSDARLPVFLLCGGMVSGPGCDAVADAAKVSLSHFVDLQNLLLPSDLAGCRKHPNVSGNEKIARVLIAKMQAELGWD